MKFTMNAFIQGVDDETHHSVQEWDYYFEADSKESAENEADSIRRSFNSHNDSGSRWVEGPFLVE